MEIHANSVGLSATCSSLARNSRRRQSVNTQKVPFRPRELSQRPPCFPNKKKRVLRIHASSPEAKVERLTEEAANSVPHVAPEDRIYPWDDNKRGMRKWLHRAVRFLTHKAWVAALALFYLYNEAAAKLPWVKIKRFEAWFWTTVRCRWLPAMNAATVLGRQWWRDNIKPFNLRSAASRLALKKREMEGEMQENVEHVKQDIEDTVEQQKDKVNRNVPAKVNPLLLKENLEKRVQGVMDSSGLGNHVDTAMEKLRDAVPMLKSNDALTKAEAEAEAKAAAEAEAAEQHANASATAAAPGMVNLHVPTQVVLPSVTPVGEASSGKASSFKRSSAGKKAKQKSDEAAPGMHKSFLPLFWQGKNGKENEEPTEETEKVDSNGRRWPLPILFWK